MKRLIFHELLKWSKGTQRKPLILRGARQVGKTHVMRQLGKTFQQSIEINFERTPEAVNIFTGNLDPKTLVRDIEILTKQKIIAGKTLLFLDEIQVEPRILTSLRYFYEEQPELHVAAAGSLLDFAIESVGVPVGRVTFMHMYPVSFIEFLVAKNEQQLATHFIENDISLALNAAIHEKALRLVAEYMAIGGMPEVVSSWIKHNDAEQMQTLRRDIINAYRQDFDKYASKTQMKYLEFIFDKLPKVMATPFKYTHLSKEYRKRELEPCLSLLKKARVIHLTYHTVASGIPLGAGANFEKFKVIPLDIGLSQTLLGLDMKDWFLHSETTLINKGEITECFVAQEMLAYAAPDADDKLYYWQRESRGSSAKVDYVFVKQNDIIPIEVKSGAGTSLKSLRMFLDLHPNTPYGIRFSINNYSKHDGVHSYPLYAVAAAIDNKARLLTFIES